MATSRRHYTVAGWERLPRVTIRPLREVGDPVLRTPADEVKSFDRELAALIRDLVETVDHPGRAGLAAPQIGVGLRAFSYNIDGVIGHMVNPTIVELSEETQDGDEGCLSVPGIWAPTVRAMHAVAEGFDVHGEPLRLEGSGLMARCLQHEVDHLDGRLFLDRLTGDARKSALRALRAR
jgi:peptide deformylase